MHKRLYSAVPLLPGAAALDLHSRAWPAIEAMFGAALVAMALLWFRRGRKAEPREGAPEPQPEANAPGRQVPAPLRIRGLLLLNLAPSEGRAQIETAPPLGSRCAVIDAITAIAPGIRFDADGHGEVTGPDHLLRLELGSEDPVAAVTAAAEGGRGVELLRALMQTNGWRAYAPRMGRFIEADGLDFFALPDDRSPESMF